MGTQLLHLGTISPEVVKSLSIDKRANETEKLLEISRDHPNLSGMEVSYTSYINKEKESLWVCSIPPLGDRLKLLISQPTEMRSLTIAVIWLSNAYNLWKETARG